MVEWGDHIQFKDSLQFLNESLEQLVKNLKDANEDKFKYLKSGFLDLYPNQYAMLKQKGVYPYDWMNDWKKMDQP